MKKIKFNIKGMHCSSCSASIENELKNHKAISMSKVDYETGKSIVVFDEDKISPKEINELIKKAGDYIVEDDINNKKLKSNNKNMSKKKNFLLGFTIGIAILAVVGFFVMMTMYLGQKNSGDISKVEVVNKNAKADNRPAPTPSVAAKVDIRVSPNDNIRGNKNAPITIIEFSDFQCPYCSSFHSTMKKVIENYPNDVRWVYKHFPLDSIHPVARKAAEASECAGDQDKFWEYSDALFGNSRLTESSLSVIAKDVGLNVSKFNSCLEDGTYAAKVEADFQQGSKAGVRGTPGSFINGESIPGAVPYGQIEAMIESLL